MKFCAVAVAGAARVGVVRGDDVVLLPERFDDLVELAKAGQEGLDLARATLKSGTEIVQLADAQLLAPVRRYGRDVLCTGWNYWDHFEEGRSQRPDVERPIAPTFFTKSPDTVIGPFEDIAIDTRMSVRWDYEAELAIVIGKTGRSIPRARTGEYIFGYMLANDISQRELQRRHGGQWLKGKSIDRTMPLGPFVVTPDEVDLARTRITCTVNGETRQDALATQMAFNVQDLIAELSLGMTLHAGDVLLTGTPSGVGNARKPPIYLAPGDLVTIAATGLGEQRNRMVEVDLMGDSDVKLEAAKGAAQ
jgi:2-keto-4-pentenoate hydratase/2-oxohepta-3-ene-1,7-dioic acid hydratase in catechol pathway